MVVFSRFKVGVILFVCALGALFVSPNLMPDRVRSSMPLWLQRTVNLGLDLRGGSHLQLQVGIKSVEKEYLSRVLGDVRKALRKKQLKYSGLNIQTDAKEGAVIVVNLLGEFKIDEVVKLVRSVDSNLVVEKKGPSEIHAVLSEQAMAKRNADIVEKSIEVVRWRIDASGTKEPNIQRQGDDRIVVQLPGVGDPSEVRRLLGTMAKLSFQWVDETVRPIVQPKGQKIHLPVPPVGTVYLPDKQPDGTILYVPVKKKIIIHGDSLQKAKVKPDNQGRLGVSLEFDSVGRQQMFEASQNVRKQFAIVLDNEVLSAPVFNEPIPGGEAIITGHFSLAEANELALLLGAGALPAPLNIVQESVVGPSLGADSIAHGKTATIMAFALVAVFMFMAYSYLGIFADIALVVNIMLLFASLSVLGATLTLPGIAGIALTIGMAVDANVLIFERIKEEARTGMRVLSAIDNGYRRAMSAILDSNLTTLIGAWILYYLGTGAVRGFAITFALGVIISMFTALTLTQWLLTLWVQFSKKKTLPF